MKDKLKNVSKRTLLIMVICLISLISIGSYAVISSKGILISKSENKAKKSIIKVTETVKPAEKVPEFDYLSYSKAELSIKGLVNSSDLYKMKTLLKKIQGIEKVLIDLENGIADVFFDEAILQNADIIAEKIEEKSDFQAQITKVLTKDEISSEDDYNQKIKTLYAATVNDFDISMADLNKEVDMYKSQYRKRYGDDVFNSPSSSQIYENINAQSMMALIDDAVLRSNIYKSDFSIKNDIVEKEIATMLKGNSLTLEEAAKSYGYNDKDYFYKKLETQVLIQNFADNKLFKANTKNEQKGLLYNKWVADCKSLCKTKYYNSNLKAAVDKAKSCGIDGCGDPGCK